MAISPIDSELFSGLFTSAEISAIFSDAQFLQAMLAVEVALARVQARLHVIPQSAADRISTASQTFQPDTQAIALDVAKSGVPTIEFVRQLRQHIGSESADYVHWGATSQDILDTATVPQYRAALEHIETGLKQVIGSLAQRADKHRQSLMAGRTYMQAAVPMSFGGKVATWIAPLLRQRERLSQMKSRVLVVQLGGAVGTLASLGALGSQVHDELAHELDLHVPLLQWHTQRDSLVELANWLAMLSACLGKIAQDIILMAQSEVGEIEESDDPTRGGSSTMPQKHNPVLSGAIVTCARTNATLVSALHQAMLQEHERGTHGWHMERLNLTQMFALTAAAIQHMHYLSQHMVVNVAKMRENLDASHGVLLAEAVNFALSAYMSRTEAKRLLADASQQALSQNRYLIDILREKLDYPIDWDSLKNEHNYLGASEEWIKRVLHQAQKEQG